MTITLNNEVNGARADDLDIPVLIIGGGPAGLLQAHLLTELKVKCLVIERYPQRLAAPKAHALSPRSLEICRQSNLSVNKIRSLGSGRRNAHWVNFLTSLTGEQVGFLPYERMDVRVLEDTPEMIHNIPQPTFEGLVADQLLNTAGVEIRKNHSFVSFAGNDEVVTTVVENRNTGEHYEIRSKHVIACDGARSKVRQFLKIESTGEDSYESMMTIHFNADLTPVVGDRVGMLHWIMDPEVAGFIIAYDLAGNQVLICNFDAKKHPVESWDEALARKTVDAAIGKRIKYDILSYRPWILSRKVAKQYRSGNVFLAGDAAHSFPPTGGLGLNSGLGDVHNLAYKIAAVHHGWGSESLLDSYGGERRHVAEVNSQQSVKNGNKIFSLLRTIGLNHPDPDIARANLFRSIHNADKMKEITLGVEDQREHFDNLELHIGYVYGSTTFPPHASHYQPKFVANARLPHSWIRFNKPLALPAIDVSYVSEFTPQEVKDRRYSTLDLCPLDHFSIITAAADSRHWDACLAGVKQELAARGIPVPLCHYSFGKDFNVIPGSPGDIWAQKMGLNSGGGAVVRPDQHILKMLTGKEGAEEIITSLLSHLGFST